MSVLRVFRVFRLGRTLRALKKNKDIQTILKVTIGSGVPFMNNITFLAFILLMFGVLGMQLFGNLMPTNSRPHFNNFLYSVLALFQTLTGDSWESILFNCQKADATWAPPFFVVFFVTGNYITLNLFIAAILEGFNEKDEDKEEEEEEEEEEENEDGGGEENNEEEEEEEEEAEGDGPLFVDSVHSHNPLANLDHDDDDDETSPLTPLSPNRKRAQPVSLRLGSPALGDSRSGSGVGTGSGVDSPVFTLNEQMRVDLLNAFKLFDVDGSGEIDLKELADLMICLGVNMSQKQLHDMVAEVDSDGSMEIDFDEFLNMICPSGEPDDDDSDSEEDIEAAEAVVETRLESLLGLPLDEKALFVFEPRHSLRLMCQEMMTNPWFEHFILFSIAFSSMTLALDTPKKSARVATFLQVCDIIFLIIFVTEMLIKNIALGFYWTHPTIIAIITEGNKKEVESRGADNEEASPSSSVGVTMADTVTSAASQPRKVLPEVNDTEEHLAYLQQGWNRLDFFIVMVSIADFLFRGVAFLKVLRLGRALRPLRMINQNPGMKIVIVSLVKSLEPVFSVVVLTLAIFLIFGILGLTFFMGLFWSCNDDSSVIEDKDDCVGIMNVDGYIVPRNWSQQAQNFDHIFNALNVLMEVSTLDSWEGVMFNAMDLNGINYQPILDVSMVNCLYFVAFVFIGSIMMTQVFVAVIIDNYSKSQGEDISEEQSLYRDITHAVQNMCSDRTPKPKRGDHLCAGCYDIFVDCYPEENCTHPLHYLHKNFDNVIITCVCLNVAFMATEHGDMTSKWSEILYLQNLIFLLVFTVEMAIKVAAILPCEYIRDPWNSFDGFVVFGSWIGFFVPTLSIFRLFRILRIVRVVQRVPSLKALVSTIINSFINVANILVLLFLVFFIYAVIGIQLFGQVRFGATLTRQIHFQDFPTAMLVLIRCMFGNYIAIKNDCMLQPPACSSGDDWTDCGQPAFVTTVYFSAFLVTATYIFLNLFVAVVLENFTFLYSLENASSMESIGLTLNDLSKFMKVWDGFDPLNTGFLAIYPDTSVIYKVLHDTGTPLAKVEEDGNIPDFWLKSMEQVLLRKATQVDEAGTKSISVLDFVMALVTRTMGTAAMSKDERKEYMKYVRASGSTQLGSLARDIMTSNSLPMVEHRFRWLQETKEKAAEDESKKKRIESQAPPTAEEQLSLMLAATQHLLKGQELDTEGNAAARQIDAVLSDVELREKYKDWKAPKIDMDAVLQGGLEKAGLRSSRRDSLRKNSIQGKGNKLMGSGSKRGSASDWANKWLTDPSMLDSQDPEEMPQPLEEMKQPVEEPATSVSEPSSISEEVSGESLVRIEEVVSQPAMTGWVLDSETNELFEKYFNRYDLDESGLINSQEEMKGLVTNLCVKLKIKARPNDLGDMCEATDISASPLDLDRFVVWFTTRFQQPTK